MRFSVLYPLCVGLTFAVSATLDAAPPKSPQIHSVVLPANLAAGLAKQCSRQSPTGSFKTVPLSASEKSRLDAALPAFLKTHGKKADAYYYQYGVLARGKKRLIYVNAFAPDDWSLKNWQKVPVMVCDGGASFWGVEYDVAQNKFQNLSFNGPYR